MKPSKQEVLKALEVAEVLILNGCFACTPNREYRSPECCNADNCSSKDAYFTIVKLMRYLEREGSVLLELDDPCKIKSF